MSKNVDKKCFSVKIQTFTHIFHVCNTCTVLFTYLTLSYRHLLKGPKSLNSRTRGLGEAM